MKKLQEWLWNRRVKKFLESKAGFMEYMALLQHRPKHLQSQNADLLRWQQEAIIAEWKVREQAAQEMEARRLAFKQEIKDRFI